MTPRSPRRWKFHREVALRWAGSSLFALIALSVACGSDGDSSTRAQQVAPTDSVTPTSTIAPTWTREPTTAPPTPTETPPPQASGLKQAAPQAPPPTQHTTTQLVLATRADGLYVNDLRITSGVTDREAAFSPDGHTVAFVRYTLGNSGSWSLPSQVCLVPVTGGDTRCIARDGMMPEWSPDGRSLFFISPPIHEPVRYDVASGAIAPIPVQITVGPMGPSPNGRYLLVTLIPFHAGVIALDGTIVAEFSNKYVAQGWSLDGKVMFSPGLGGPWFWADPLGGELSPATEGCPCKRPVALPVTVTSFTGSYQSRFPWGFTLCEASGG